MMGLPEQLKRQQEQVEAYDRQVQEAAAPPPEPPQPETPPEPPAPEPPAPQPTPVPPPATDEAALWKQRFLSLQGMFNQQVPSLQQQVKDLAALVADLQKPKPTAAAPEAPKALVTKEDEA